MSEPQWLSAVEQAQGRATIFERVQEDRRQTGQPWALCLQRITEEVPPTAFVHWRRWVRNWPGPLWERFLFHRWPPPAAKRTSEQVVTAAEALRHGDPQIGVEAAQQALRKQFGAEVTGASPTNLKRIWRRAGLCRPAGGVVTEEVEEFTGGAGLVVLQAVDEELGASTALAQAIQEAGRKVADTQGEVEVREEREDERNERGQFTAQYNRHWREDVEPGKADGRWSTEATKRAERDLSALPMLKMQASTLAGSLLQMGMTWLLTSRRGFDGVEDPPGNWLGVLGRKALMPATMDKRATELGILGVEGAMWAAHERTWYPVAQQWAQQAGGGWLQIVVYVDASLDPYWTERYALTGKIERTGRVAPSVMRTVITSGPGVPLVVETVAGMVSLKTHLLPMLDRLDKALGPGQVKRLVVFDAEAATAKVIAALKLDPRRGFVTVLKGPLLRAVTVTPRGDWTPYRERDQVREAEVVIPKKHAGLEKDLVVRAVELQRPSRRHPYRRIYLTGQSIEEAATEVVPNIYLTRWPHQEQLFRDARRAAGWNRTHGYGGQFIANVAVVADQERAQQRVERAERKHELLEGQRRTAEQQAGPRPKDPAVKATVSLARRSERGAARELKQARAALQKVETTPATIYARDTTRDSQATCLKLTVLMLISYALRTLFGGLRIEWGTFIDAFVPLPVTVRTTSTRILYQFHANPRAPVRMLQLQAACEVLNAKKLRRGERQPRLLVFEVVGLPPPAS